MSSQLMAPGSVVSISSLEHGHDITADCSPRILHILIASTGEKELSLEASLLQKAESSPCIVIRVLSQTADDSPTDRKAALLAKWADVLLITPIAAQDIGNILLGSTSTLLLDIIRSWDASKTIVLTPGMSVEKWRHPMTAQQLEELKSKFPWVKVTAPVLSYHTSGATRIDKGNGLKEVWDVIAEHSDRSTAISSSQISMQPVPPSKRQVLLPGEIWVMIFDRVGDWELATNLKVHTNLPVPKAWLTRQAEPITSEIYRLDLAILKGTTKEIKKHLQSLVQRGPQQNLFTVELLTKFDRRDIFAHLRTLCPSTTHADFWPASFPFLASKYNRVALLDMWLREPPDNNITAANRPSDLRLVNQIGSANDLASLSASSASDPYPPPLHRWQASSIGLQFAVKALEYAASTGRVDIVKWFTQHTSELPLKPGRTLIAATQAGRVEVIRYLYEEGVVCAHEEEVARRASAHGQVGVLQLWKELKGEKMVFDERILVEPTKRGFVEVLEWWRTSGYRVEYKTCEIEEALEEADGWRGGDKRVRQWWIANGLDLSLRTGEWIEKKVLKGTGE